MTESMCMQSRMEIFAAAAKYMQRNKLPWFSCILRHSAMKRGGLI